jgi:hypothetical protein
MIHPVTFFATTFIYEKTRVLCLKHVRLTDALQRIDTLEYCLEADKPHINCVRTNCQKFDGGRDEDIIKYNNVYYHFLGVDSYFHSLSSHMHAYILYALL